MIKFIQALSRLVFFTVSILFICNLFTQELPAKDLSIEDLKSSVSNVYLVESITSKASGKTPSSSKASAVSNARRDAFMVLLLRLKLPIATADNITNEEIAEMVRSEQILDEKFIGNNYSASFNIVFAKDFVDHILTKKFQEKELDTNNKKPREVEKTLEKYFVFPVKMAKKQPLMWEMENDWKTIFERTIAKNNLQKNFIIPEANPNNILLINSQNIKNPSFSNVEKMLGTDDSFGVYFLYFNFDEIENKVLIEVIYLRKLLKKQFRLSFINVDKLSYNDLIIKVSEKTLDYINNNPIGSDDILNRHMIQLNIKIKAFQNWLNVKNIIEGSNLIDDVEIISISKDIVRISVNYINTKISIEEGLGKLGLDLIKRDSKFYEINAISQ